MTLGLEPLVPLAELKYPKANRLGRPPVSSLEQDLPFRELDWFAFEALCLRLIRAEADAMKLDAKARRYGRPGQRQQGIDIYAKNPATDLFRTYQCKQVESLGPAKIREAVQDFLDGEFGKKSEFFALCTTLSTISPKQSDEYDLQSDRLKALGIKLEFWGAEELALKLKERPDLVAEFFMDPWIDVFCGPGHRPPPSPASRFPLVLPTILAVCVLLLVFLRLREPAPEPLPPPPPPRGIIVVPSTGSEPWTGAEWAEPRVEVTNEGDHDLHDQVLRIEIHPPINDVEDFMAYAVNPGADVVKARKPSGKLKTFSKIATGTMHIDGMAVLFAKLGTVGRGKTIEFFLRIRVPKSGIRWRSSVVPLAPVREFVPEFYFGSDPVEYERLRIQWNEAGVRFHWAPLAEDGDGGEEGAVWKKTFWVPR